MMQVCMRGVQVCMMQVCMRGVQVCMYAYEQNGTEWNRME